MTVNEEGLRGQRRARWVRARWVRAHLRAIGMLGAAAVLALPLVAPAGVALATGTPGLCAGAVLVVDPDPDGLTASEPPVLTSLLVAGVEHLLAVEVLEVEDERECPTGIDGVAFRAGVSLPTDVADLPLRFEAELTAMSASGPEYVGWDGLWQARPDGVTIGDAVVPGAGSEVEGALLTATLEDEVETSTFVSGPFVVSTELAGLDLRVAARLLDAGGVELAAWDVEDLRVGEDLCLVVMFLPEEAVAAAEGDGDGGGGLFAAGTAELELEPGDATFVFVGVEPATDGSADPEEEGGAGFCSEDGPGVVRIVPAADVPATFEFLAVVYELARSGHGPQAWMELMEEVSLTDIASGQVDSVGFDGDGFLVEDFEDEVVTADRLEVAIGMAEAVGGLVIRLALADDAQPGEYPLDLSLLAGDSELDTDGSLLSIDLVRLASRTVLSIAGVVATGPETDPLRLTLIVPGGQAEDGGTVGGDGDGGVGDGDGDSGDVDDGGAGPAPVPDVDGTLTCSAPSVGADTSCTLVAAPGRTFTWEASTNPLFATGQVTTGADGTATFSFAVPEDRIGQPIVVRVLGVAGAARTIGVAGPPIPTAVPAGEGPPRPVGLLALLLGLAGVAGLAGVPTRPVVTGPRRAVPAPPR